MCKITIVLHFTKSTSYWGSWQIITYKWRQCFWGWEAFLHVGFFRGILRDINYCWMWKVSLAVWFGNHDAEAEITLAYFQENVISTYPNKSSIPTSCPWLSKRTVASSKQSVNGGHLFLGCILSRCYPNKLMSGNTMQFWNIVTGVRNKIILISQLNNQFN